MKLKIALLAVIVVLFTALLRTCDKAKRVDTMLKSAQIEARYWKDEEGRSNAEVGVLRVENFKLTKLADSLKNVEIKPHTVVRVETVHTHTSGETLVIKDRQFGDSWAKFEIKGPLLKYSFTDSIALVTHTKRVGLFQRAYVTRAISFNPHTRLTGVTSTEILPKTRRISIGMHGGYGLQFRPDGIVSHGWNFGVGINFRVF